MVITYMEDLAQPIYCGFVETNYEEEFLDFSSKFYYELFWAEEIYVSYNFFTDPSNYELEPNVEMPEEIDYYARTGGFDS